MAKIIRPSYPLEFSIGLLLLIFSLSTFVSFEIFDVSWREVIEGNGPITGMILCGVSIVIMALILWEEFLFPVRIKPNNDEIIFRNHFTKLKTEVLFYCAIPVITTFIYLKYEVNAMPFFIWAGICVLAPLGKLISGIKNYNDFLKLTNDTIEYKNNEKEGILRISETKQITLIKDQDNVLHKVKVQLHNNTDVIIDLDEMELEAYYETIDQFIRGHFGNLVK